MKVTLFKRIVSCFMAIVMFCFVFIPDLTDESITVNASTKITYGDVNSDSSVNVLDLIRLKSKIIEKSAIDIDIADINDDGEISVKDTTEMTTYLLGCVPAFSVEINNNSDKDGLCDYIEKLLGTNSEKDDSDEDGKNDFEELYYYGTDPLLFNSQQTKTIVDTDNDGINNKCELENGTNLLLTDSDDDKISDNGEKILGLDPTKKNTDGTPDNMRIFNQHVDSDNPVLNEINDGNSNFQLSISSRCSGYINESINVSKSVFSDYLQTDSVVGDIIDINYSDNYKVEELNLLFNINNKNIKNYCVFKYFKNTKTLIPIKTIYEGNTISISDFETGTYCVMDIQKWCNSSKLQYTKNINNVFSSSKQKMHIIFAVDLSLVSKDYNIQNAILDLSNLIFKKFDNDMNDVSIEICTFSYTPVLRTVNATSSYGAWEGDFNCLSDIEDYFEFSPDQDNFGTYRNFSSSMITPLDLARVSYNRGKYNYNYVLTMASNKYADIDLYSDTTLKSIKNIPNIHGSYLIPSDTSEKNKSYFESIANEYNGKVFSEYNVTIDNSENNRLYQQQIIDHINNTSGAIPSKEDFYNFINSNYNAANITPQWKDAAQKKIPIDELKTLNFPDADKDGSYDYEEINWTDITFDTKGKPVFPTYYVYAGEAYTGSNQSEAGVAWFEEFCSENNMNPGEALNTYILPINSYPDRSDSDKDGRDDRVDPDPKQHNIFYNRNAVRQYAQKWSSSPVNHDNYVYLQGNVTDCANFVSQCISSGGYQMTDDWYMYKYSNENSELLKFVNQIKSKSSKIPALIQEDIQQKLVGKIIDPSIVFVPGLPTITIKYDYPCNTYDNYIFSNPWGSAEWQIRYGIRNFYSNSTPIIINQIVGETEDIAIENIKNISNYVKKNNIQVGDALYIGNYEDNYAGVHHAMMITNITEDGKLCLSGHSSERNDKILDEKWWMEGGFGDLSIFKVNDVIK